MERLEFVEKHYSIGDLNVKLKVADASNGIYEELESKNIELPYWAELFPPAAGLALLLHQLPISGKKLLEFGSGTGLTGIVASLLGSKDVLMSDLMDYSVKLMKENVNLNQTNVEIRQLDWNIVHSWSKDADIILASEVLYDSSFKKPVANLLFHILGATSTAIISDPDRGHLDSFIEELSARGLKVFKHEKKFFMFEGMEFSAVFVEVCRGEFNESIHAELLRDTKYLYSTPKLEDIITASPPPPPPPPVHKSDITSQN